MNARRSKSSPQYKDPVMEEEEHTELSKWPFIFAYIALLGVAVAIVLVAPKPYSIPAMTGAIICALVGPVFLLLPFLVEYFSRLKQERNQLRVASEEQFASSLRLVGELEALQKVFSRQAGQGAANIASMEGLVPQLEKHSEHIDRLAKEFSQTAKSEKKAQTLASLESVATDMSSLHKQFKKIPALLEKSIGQLQEQNQESSSKKELERIVKLLEGYSDQPMPMDDLGDKQSVKKTKADSQQDDFGFEETTGPETDVTPSNGEERGDLTRTELDDPESVSLVVNLLSSIGNIPYVRGEGAGLSWEEGVEMQFVEIGKWEWHVPGEGEPVRARIYLNDKISAFGEDIELNAGEQVEVFPEFPDS